MLEAFNARDYDAWVSGCTEDVEIESRFSRVGGTTYTGHEEVRVWWKDLDEAWDPMTVEEEGIVEVGTDRTVTLMTLHGTGRESGLKLEERVALRSRWRGDLMEKMEYMDRLEAELIARP